MGVIALAATARPVDWGGLAVLALLTAAMAAYAVFMLGRRARLLVRAGWAGARMQWGQWAGLLCGTVGFALAILDIGTGWLAEARSTGINWHSHQWTSFPMIVCGWVVIWTEPGRPRSVLDSTIAAKARAHPRQALAGLLLGTATWAFFPLIAMVPASIRFYIFLVWPALMFTEIGIAIWWWWRHGQIEELTDGQRTVYLPSYGTHPVFWGWLSGMLAFVLVWAVVDQMRMGL